MRRAGFILFALSLAVAALLPACGEKGQSQSNAVAEIKAAIRKSPQTYFAFRNPLYWGRPVHITIDRIRISSRDDHFAAARVRVLEASGKPVRFARIGNFAQQVLLKRSAAWRVRDVESGSPIPCRFAPHGVVRDLLDSCDASPYQPSDVGLIAGPESSRSPTAKERALIIKATRAYHHGVFDVSCARFHIQVSKTDDRFALVGYTFVPPYTKCVLGNGESWMERASTGRWRVKGDGSDAPDCRCVPPGVARNLASICNIARDWPYRKRT
ncbi:MAG: hypothetical protein WBQ14_03600 [Gaiellaceae bacterium]